jgi:hypothetical protein
MEQHIATRDMASRQLSLSMIQTNELVDYADMVRLMSVTDIVDAIVDKKFAVPTKGDAKLVNNAVMFPTDPNKKYVDDDKFLKDIATNVVNKFFYSSSDTTLKFFSLINDMFTNALLQYADKKKFPKPHGNYINFIFKGGNILRLIVEAYLREMPEHVIKQIRVAFRRYFAKSDADFQINIRNMIGLKNANGVEITKDDMDAINREVTDMTYLLLNRIRNIILAELRKYVNYYRLNKEAKKEILLRTLRSIHEQRLPKKYEGVTFIKLDFDDISVGSIPEGARVKSVGRDTYGEHDDRSSRRDVAVDIKRPERTELYMMTVPYLHEYPTMYSEIADTAIQKKMYKDYNDTSFFIMHNTTLEQTHHDIFVRFNLVRMKINMKAYYVKQNAAGKDVVHDVSMAGEYIDVSIPHYTSTANIELFSDLDKNVVEYTASVEEGKVTFKSYSFDKYLTDIEYVLYYDSEFPWDAEKFIVRLNRSLLMMAMDLLRSDIPMAEKIEIVSDVIGRLNPDNLANLANVANEIGAAKINQNKYFMLEYYKLFNSILLATKENKYWRSMFEPKDERSMYRDGVIRKMQLVAEQLAAVEKAGGPADELAKLQERVRGNSGQFLNMIIMIRRNFEVLLECLNGLRDYVAKDAKISKRLVDIGLVGGDMENYRKYKKYKKKYMALKAMK